MTQSLGREGEPNSSSRCSLPGPAHPGSNKCLTPPPTLPGYICHRSPMPWHSSPSLFPRLGPPAPSYSAYTAEPGQSGGGEGGRVRQGDGHRYRKKRSSLPCPGASSAPHACREHGKISVTQHARRSPPGQVPVCFSTNRSTSASHNPKVSACPPGLSQSPKAVTWRCNHPTAIATLQAGQEVEKEPGWSSPVLHSP